MIDWNARKRFIFNLDTVLGNSIPGKICQFEQDGISAKKFEAAQIYFLRDDFAAVDANAS